MASSILDLSPWDFAATIALTAASLLIAWRSAHILLAGLQMALVGLCLWLLWVVTPSVPFGDFAHGEPSLSAEVSTASLQENPLHAQLSSPWSLAPPAQ